MGDDRPVRRRRLNVGFRTTLSLFVTVCLSQCATSPSHEPSPPDLSHIFTERISLKIPEGSLGDAVRLLGEEVKGGFVVMHGTENRPLTGPIQFRGATYSRVAQRLAKMAGCEVDETREYYFIYPSGYESLKAVSLEGKVPQEFAQMTVSVSFGAKTELYTAFAFLSHTLGLTIVADNGVAEARCGELNLHGVSLRSALEAILKSARIPNDTIRIDTTDEYVFFQTAQLPPQPPSQLLNAETLTERQREVLNGTVSVILPLPPGRPGQFERHFGGIPLAEILPSLSRQLGVRVQAEPGLEAFPVNPAVFNEVSRATVMDLLIRQWPVSDFGYSFVEKTLLIHGKSSAADP